MAIHRSQSTVTHDPLGDSSASPYEMSPACSLRMSGLIPVRSAGAEGR
jgi:hypothetical protein